jgi:hypothetical protein
MVIIYIYFLNSLMIITITIKLIIIILNYTLQIKSIIVVQ